MIYSRRSSPTLPVTFSFRSFIHSFVSIFHSFARSFYLSFSFISSIVNWLDCLQSPFSLEICRAFTPRVPQFFDACYHYTNFERETDFKQSINWLLLWAPSVVRFRLRSFVRSFVRSFLHSLVISFVPSVVCSRFRSVSFQYQVVQLP